MPKFIKRLFPQRCPYTRSVLQRNADDEQHTTHFSPFFQFHVGVIIAESKNHIEKNALNAHAHTDTIPKIFTILINECPRSTS